MGPRKVEVINRVGEQGTRQRSYIVSREVAEADGRVRTISTVLDSEDIRAIDGARKAMRLERAQAREARQQKAQERAQAPEAKAEAKEAERPVQAVPPPEERKAQERGRAPSTQAAPYQDNTHWVLGTWHGDRLPKLGEAIWFERGKPKPEDRFMTPVNGNTRAPDPGERPRYVMAEIVDAKQGLAVVRGSTVDREYAVHQTARYERDKEAGRSLQAEQERYREAHQERGLAMGL